MRDYNFIVGPETSVLPTASDPSAISDFMSKGYADDTYAQRTSWFDRAADIAAIRAIVSTDLANGTRIFNYGNQTEWYYNTSSNSADDGVNVLKPDDVSGGSNGRWLILTSGAAAASSSAAGIEVLEQKLEAEHSDIFTPNLDNSVGSGFSITPPTVVGRLLADYTSGATSASIVWNPLYIDDSDKNTDSTTGWTAVATSAAANLTTSGTKKIGTASLSFDKNGTATNARIQKALAAATMNINGYTDLYFWINLPSITNLTNIEVRIDVDNTNYQTFTATTDHAGTALAVGWQLMKFDLSIGGVATGTGWDKSKLFRYLHIGVNASSAGQTYTAILVDAIHFGLANHTQLIQVGNEYTIYDSSNIANLKIDTASPRAQGTITLDASLGNNFSGGTSSTVKRNTLVIGADGAFMEDGLSGSVADAQVVRLQAYLPASISSQNFKVTAMQNSPMYFEVTGVTDSDTIVVSDAADSTANIVSGRKFDIFQAKYSADGKLYLIPRDVTITVSLSLIHI